MNPCSTSTFPGSSGTSAKGLTLSPNVKTCANPIIEQWLIEWKKDAEERDSKMQFVFGKALSSIRKHPLPLGSGEACKSLKYFGHKLARKIDERIAKENVCLAAMPMNDGTSSPPVVDSQRKPMHLDAGQCDKDVAVPKAKPIKKLRPYTPAYRSGGYAILVAMGKREKTTSYRGYMLKTEILNEARCYSDSLLASVWQAMATLVKRDLVKQEGHPIQYTLTEVGRKQAAMLMPL